MYYDLLSMFGGYISLIIYATGYCKAMSLIMLWKAVGPCLSTKIRLNMMTADGHDTPSFSSP